MRDETIEQLTGLVRWAWEQRSLPPAVRARSAQVLADDLAATIAARDEPEVAAFQRRTLETAALAEATIWRGGQARTDRMSAAVANALAGDWLELDEGYRPVACHAGLYVLPALLAEAEATDLTCADVLHALAIGYEVVTRIARAWTQRELTMQAHGRYAALGAAAGLALARRLDERQMLSALGAAATFIGPAPRNHLEEGVLIRNAWPASGAWHGFMSLEWSRCGMGGAPGALFDVYSTVLGGQVDPSRLTQALGGSWAVMEGYTKVFACCQHLHAAVQAALEFAPLAVEEVQAIEVRCHPLAMAFAESRPATSLGAKFSMPHAVAATLVLGTGGAPAFAAGTLHDPRIAALRGKVVMSSWQGDLAPPNDRPARVLVSLHDGRRLESECLSAPGTPANPLPADAWRAKVRELAAPAYPRFPDVMDELFAGEAHRLAQPWRDVVRELAAPAAGVTRP